MNKNAYSDEFKKQAVILLRQVGISKACKAAHVTRATLYRWNKTYDKEELECGDMTQGFETNIKDNNQNQSVNEELRQLQVYITAQKGLNRKLKKALMLLLSDEESVI